MPWDFFIAGLICLAVALLIMFRRVIFWLAILVWIVADPLDAMRWFGIVLAGMLAWEFVQRLADEGWAERSRRTRASPRAASA